MKRVIIFFALLFLIPSILIAQKVFIIRIDGSINPVSADFIHHCINKANAEKATCLVIYLNTPGGLLQSTRNIVHDLLEAPLPIVVYVAPGGAHAGSAGVFVTIAAHIAAMAPGTNIGAAHPVGLQGMDTVMSEKVTNDAAAFIRSIASRRNRNLEWAEQSVRKSLSITENEALEKKVIDLVAANQQELLNRIDGKGVNTSAGIKVLHTKYAQTETLQMGMTEKILSVLTDPNVIYILLLLGFYGILFELYNPGAILPGIVGVISLVIAFYSMQALPVNYAGLALIIFAIVLFVLEIKIISHGMLTIGGIVSLLLGSLMLIHSDSALESVRISLSVIIAAVTVTTLFFLFIIGAGLRAQRAKPATGIEAMVGETGEALDILNPSGNIMVHGEIWKAESVEGQIEQGEKIRIIAVKQLNLIVGHLIT
ncbi:nodulation protein NfeD [Chitinophaga sp. CF418]|uniref:NfeD family protein n=1 Tax=Chitinophaga sp. CF418 TaxID=1855287 RepID=UPI000923684C|nr:nodulation protein NfeD [Chitinophaga sp. CF418]SHN34075.1 membrane-bound serine protease (ClpP class) [Chitinophaga sp. CF418]